ncbi:hypothetical protein [Streptomyces sp. NPDC001980]|uniref:hypothetical protein n=1 Tax=Streptomyces sp. NPDC001980 TaxID=3157126 RepID=UPI0033321F51
MARETSQTLAASVADADLGHRLAAVLFGLGLGTVVTGALFRAVILGLVVFLSVTRKDVTQSRRPMRRTV